MAKHYNKLPSEILRIEDEYTSYCFDEVCYFYEKSATTEDGGYDWDKIDFIDKESKYKNNNEFKEFITKHKKAVVK